MGLLDFMKGGKKGGNTAAAAPPPPQQATTDMNAGVPPVPGATPFMPGNLASNSTMPGADLPGAVTAENMPQAGAIGDAGQSNLPMDPALTGMTSPSTDPTFDQGMGTVPSELQPFVDNNQSTIQSDPGAMADTGLGVTTPQASEETIFGEGDLGSIYNNNFPDATNLDPMPPAGMDDTSPVVQDVPTVDNLDVGTALANDTMDPMQAQIPTMDKLAATDPLASDPLDQSRGILAAPDSQPDVVDPIDTAQVPTAATGTEAAASVAEPVASTKPAVTEVEFGTSAPAEADATDVTTPPVAEDVLPEVIAEEAPAVVETKVVETPVTEEVAKEEVPIIEQAPATSGKKFFRKVAFMGVEGPSVNLELGNSVKSLVKKLLNDNIEILVDSKNGLGEHIVQAATSISQKVTGIYLKPYLSSEFGKPSVQITESDSFSILYSNYIERLRHFAKDARLYIVFDGGGIYNLSILTTLWAISHMYSGQHKPIILVGTEWHNIVNTLQSAVKLTDKELQVLSIVDTPEGVLEEIERLNGILDSNKDIAKVEKVIDRRVEGDEKDYIVY